MNQPFQSNLNSKRTSTPASKMETVYVGDNFEMLVTDSLLEKVAKIVILLPTNMVLKFSPS